MITYEEALLIARNRKTNIDTCTEYTTAYVFTSTEDDHYDGGYGHTPCVVLKESDEIISLMQFGITGDSTPIRKFEVS